MGTAINPQIYQQSLDDVLSKIKNPGPLIIVSESFPIESMNGWGNPMPGFYKGARVRKDFNLKEGFYIQESIF